MIEIADSDLLSEIDGQLAAMEENLEELKKELRFTGKFDSKAAILRITAGVGGTEAMDWAGMLERMYLRFIERNNFTAKLIERQTGEEAGIKTAVYEIDGTNAYGTFKSEHGVHRLVRLSPFNADNLRQTSFSLVEVLPVMDNDTDIVIDEKDLRIDVYHASGHGGQGVNTTDSAVRITHIPTGIVVACQTERSQLMNRQTCMNMLKARLYEYYREQKEKENSKFAAEKKDISFGSQIRSYVFCPYTMVKDHRTRYSVGNIQAVMDGDLDDFMNAYLVAKWKGLPMDGSGDDDDEE
jgi:peptide chain release factor 2